MKTPDKRESNKKSSLPINKDYAKDLAEEYQAPQPTIDNKQKAQILSEIVTNKANSLFAKIKNEGNEKIFIERLKKTLNINEQASIDDFFRSFGAELDLLVKKTLVPK